jgi:hypothetical protein
MCFNETKSSVATLFVCCWFAPRRAQRDLCDFGFAPPRTPKNRSLLGRNMCAQIHFENGAVRFSFLKIICVAKIPRPLS